MNQWFPVVHQSCLPFRSSLSVVSDVCVSLCLVVAFSVVSTIVSLFCLFLLLLLFYYNECYCCLMSNNLGVLSFPSQYPPPPVLSPKSLTTISILLISIHLLFIRGRFCHMVVGFTTTCAISVYYH